ncbi:MULTISPECIES: uracil-DNA glycosylase family protein [Cupriavidus]|uniref:uracil-DNA glycosylase family protein n=1 Tax=Cupriavidus TaxID=106589 RepID=UPI0023E7583C|nr:uracil-DNA glycosylase family protein [Cupriavidus basilensis]MDF3882126.1 uracil-DNA glycosylase family protein [Cupriavidus basilensis]
MKPLSHVHATVSQAASQPDLEALLARVRACRACEAHLPLGPRPVVQAATPARILIVGQAPGTRVHASGIPWDDPSGDRLREWMGIDKEVFYDPARIAIIPMGLCYPGRGASGDLPPRKECAPLWMDALLACLPDIELTLLVGQYAQRRFLGADARGGVTPTVAGFAAHGPRYLPLPHPSPRNQGWFKRNDWFARELLPVLRQQVAAVLARRRD